MLPFSALLLSAVLAADPAPSLGKHFRITVVDDQTNRGVPLVELQTVHNIRCFTDSNGIVAFHEPGLMNQKVFFAVRSHGYEFPKDGFGFRGKALQVTEGGSAQLKIKRLNVAERLYRVTGAGIYADSLLAGQAVPLRRPVLNGLVFGSDSVVNAFYRGKLWWFWGDTNQAAYPLGNFHVPGATSLLPAQGGLDPEAGVDLEYFLDEKGFARPMARLPGDGPTWINGLVVLRDADGRERLFAAYVKVRGFLEIYERGLALFNDEKQQFEKLVQFPLDAPLHPDGHPFLHTVGGVEYVYFATPSPLVRARATPEDLKDLTRYEGFTCLQEGTRPEQQRLDRAADGSLRWGWKKHTAPVRPQDQARLIRAGKMKREEALLHLQEADTGKAVVAHGGSVCWNAYRQRWVMIAVESGGTSQLGEVWYAEADTPLGPWVYARKIVTHDRYSFYNPKQHPLFDKDGGRVIFFEGTYTHTFSGNPEQTPRYDYNQIMYKLDLAHPAVVLPVPVYVLSEAETPHVFGTKADLKEDGSQRPIAFFTLDRPGKGTVPVFALRQADGSLALQVGETPASVAERELRPRFYVLPADMKDPPATTVPLHEFVAEDGRRRAYSTDATWTRPGYRKSDRPFGYVWRSPYRQGLPGH